MTRHAVGSVAEHLVAASPRRVFFLLLCSCASQERSTPPAAAALPRVEPHVSVERECTPPERAELERLFAEYCLQ